MLRQFFRFMVLRGTRTVPFAFDCFLPMQLERSLAQPIRGARGDLAARSPRAPFLLTSPWKIMCHTQRCTFVLY